MSNGQSPTPPPPPQGAPPPPPPAAVPPAPSYSPPPSSPPAGASGESGLPTWAKVGIGCGCLVVVAVVALFLAGGFAIKKGVDKAKESGIDVGGAIQAAREAGENPGAAIEAVISLNPGLEVVENDPEAGKITIRNTETNEVGTFDYSEIREGRFEFETAEGSYKVDGSEAAGGGGVTFSGPDGETARLGSGTGDMPAWVPRYPNVTSEGGGYTTSTADSASGLVPLQSSATIEEIEKWYTETLEQDGFTIERNSVEFGGNRQVILNGKKEGISTMTVMIGREPNAEMTTIALTYDGPKD